MVVTVVLEARVSVAGSEALVALAGSVAQLRTVALEAMVDSHMGRTEVRVAWAAGEALQQTAAEEAAVAMLDHNIDRARLLRTQTNVNAGMD
jgi:hypothetical protein